jgi:hypothetical protein
MQPTTAPKGIISQAEDGGNGDGFGMVNQPLLRPIVDAPKLSNSQTELVLVMCSPVASQPARLIEPFSIRSAQSKVFRLNQKAPFSGREPGLFSCAML